MTRWHATFAGVLMVVVGVVRMSGQTPVVDHPEQYPAADVTAGARVYTAACANCHGATGTGVGTVDLGHGPLPRARTDAALQTVITTGFPQSGMPSFRFDANEMRTLVAYIRVGLSASVESASVPAGDAARGQIVFNGKGNCLSCHRVGTRGSFAGPDLSDAGRTRTAVAIRRSLLDPTSAMRPIDRPVRAVTKDGRTITGRRLNEDTYTVQIVTDQGRLVSLVKSDLREWSVATTSTMPAYKDTLTPGELADLVAYVVSLKE